MMLSLLSLVLAHPAAAPHLHNDPTVLLYLTGLASLGAGFFWYALRSSPGPAR